MARVLSEIVWERFAELSLDLVCAINKEGYFLHLSDSCEKILGYSKDEMLGKNFREFVFRDDLKRTAETTERVQKGGQAINFENRLTHRHGYLVWLSWSAVWSEKDGLIFCVGRDVTLPRESQTKLQASEQRYKSLLHNNPDAIFIENTEGFIVEANTACQEAFGNSFENSLRFELLPLFSPDMASVCRRAFEQTLAGNTMRFELEVLDHSGDRRIYDVVKQPIMEAEKQRVLYIQTIAKDITPIARSYETIRQQANKLNIIFESITDAFLTLDKAWRLTYINKAAEGMLGLDRGYHVGESIWDVFPDEVGGEFYRQYHHATETMTAVQFEAFYSQLRLWISVRAYPSREGLSIYFNDITEKVKYKQELEKLSLVASKTTNGVLILDDQFRIEWVNEGFTALTAYTLDDALGKTPFRLLHNPKADHAFLHRLIQQMRQGEPVSFEILRRIKSGADIWLFVQVNPILDEMGTVCRHVFVQTDITAQVKTKQELELLSLVASETTNSVIIMDCEGYTEWVNKGFENLTGYTIKEIRGLMPYQLLEGPDTDQATIARIAEKLNLKEPFQEEVLIYTKGGEKKWFEISITPILNSEGNIYKRVGIQSDITERVNAQEELSRLAKDLYRQNSDLQQFTYMLSHNLRSPVANVLGFTNLLRTVPKEHPVFENSLLKLQESTQQLDKVLRDMHTVLSVRDSKGNLELEPVNLSLVLGQVAESLQVSIMESKAELAIELGDTLAVKANKAYVYSVFHNLLSNSLKYRALTRPLRVHIKCVSSTSKGIIISFTDNGIGFDMGKAQGEVFKLYKRFHSHVPGSGIGLYLTKSHVEAMGGHIQVYSEIDAGTKFIIFLPC